MDVNEPDRFGWTPLTHAVAREDLEQTRRLLDLGALDHEIVGDPEDTGNHPPGSSIRDLAARVDAFQRRQGRPGGFVAALEAAWGPPDPPRLPGAWRCIAWRVDGQTIPWREDDMGVASVVFRDDGTFTFDTLFRLDGRWEGVDVEAEGLDTEVRFLGGGRALALALRATTPAGELALTGYEDATFWFRRIHDR